MKFLRLLVLIVLIGSVFGLISAVLYHLYLQIRTPTILSSQQNNISSSQESSEESSDTNYKYRYYQNDTKDIYVVFFDGSVDISYNPTTSKTLTEVAKSQHYDLAINGGYFTQYNTYGGLLILNGIPTTRIATNDKQASGIVLSNKANNTLTFFEARTFDPSPYRNNPNYTVFQAGPIIVDKNEININDINNSLNGTVSYFRTVIGFTESGKKFIAVTDTSYTLKELGQALLNMPIFKDEVVSVMNLDGGASTAMYSFENKQFNIDTDKILPIIIGVK